MSGHSSEPDDVPTWAADCRCGNYGQEQVDMMIADAEKAAEARIVAWLQWIADGTYDDPVSPSDIIYMIEEGEHRERPD